MIRFLALMAVGLGLTTAPLAAQPAQDESDAYESAAFQAFLESEFANRLRREALQRSMVLHQPGCVEVPTFSVRRTWPVSPIVMSEGDVAPTQGMWRERLSSTACEETVIENVVHTFTGDGQRTFLLVRGRTEASLETQLTLINDARDAAAADDSAMGCDIIRFTDTYVTGSYNDGRWQERWIADACGDEIGLNVLFEPGVGPEPTYTISGAR